MPWSWTTVNQLHDADLTDDKFWSAVSVWNSKPHLLIKHLMGAERLVSDSLFGDSTNVFDLLADQPVCWVENPPETFSRLGLNSGDDVQVEVWKLLTKKPVDWNDYLRLSIFGKYQYDLYLNLTKYEKINYFRPKKQYCCVLRLYPEEWKQYG